MNYRWLVAIFFILALFAASQAQTQSMSTNPSKSPVVAGKPNLIDEMAQAH